MYSVVALGVAGIVETTAIAVMPPVIVKRRESLPWQNVPAVVPKDPAWSTPLVPVMTGKLAVVPIAPAFEMFPWTCDAGVRESENRESFPKATVALVVPVGMRARASVPLVISAAE
jgi:hypothetical protein